MNRTAAIRGWCSRTRLHPDWQPLVGPRRADFKNANDFCRAEREFLGVAEFRARYRNFGGCVSSS